MNDKLDKRFRTLEKDHSLIYKDKEFKFDYDFFKKNSNKMKRNKKYYEDNKKIYICDDNENIDLCDDSINAVINYCQYEDYKHLMNAENIFQIYFLAEKFEIDGLMKEAKKYIIKNCDQAALDVCSFKNEFKDFRKPLFEEVIAAKFIGFINNQKILNLDVPTMYRILRKYQMYYQNNSQDINDQIIELIFKFLDKYGKRASVLFTNIDFGKEKNEYLRRLVQDYTNKFDFNMLNSALLKSIYENQNEYIKMLYKNQLQNDFINQIKVDNDKIKKENVKMKEKYEHLQKEFDIIKVENAHMQNLNTEYKKALDQARKSLDFVKAENNQLINNYSCMKKDFDLMKTEIMEMKKFMSQQKKQSNEINTNIQTEIRNLEAKIMKKITTDKNVKNYKIKKDIENINKILSAMMPNGIFEINENRQRVFERKKVCHHDAHSMFGRGSGPHTHYTIFHITQTEQRTARIDFNGKTTYSDWFIVPGSQNTREVESGTEVGHTVGYEKEIS